MKQKFDIYKEKFTKYWGAKSSRSKGVLIGSILLVLFLIIGGSIFANKSNMVPLYNNLSLQEVGQIKAELDARGLPYELQDAGKTILVPEDQANTLLVDLAAQGMPNSGNVDYSFFSANTSWGMTDNEFDVIQLDAMQTEIANLVKSIDGIQDANVMINKPEEPVFVSEQPMEASASIVVNTQPGYQLEGSQIKSLYHLVSKTVPNLPTDNIVIMNQNFEYFDLNNSATAGSTDTYTYQQNVKKDIERDIQRRVQQMIGMMVGNDKVVASVTADIDFTQENRVEELVTPVDEENMEGLPVSVESIKETYTGAAPEGGVAGTGEEEVPNYPAGEEGQDGDYEMVKESINNEFNRIKKEIVESPYKIRDLGIQVAVDNTKEPATENGEVEYLSAAEEATVEDGIASILDSIITTSIDKEYGEVNPEEKVSIVLQEFNGNQGSSAQATVTIPTWMYIVGGLLVVIILALVWLLWRRKGTKEEEEQVEFAEETYRPQPAAVPDIEENPETEATIRTKQLEKMAQEKPEEFAKLLRSWIAED
ncbi:flagellar basal-body MS-ring/collar protein FliF [Sediminibacillus albus]|uniref:Flagellar M-ring protein n=1 Tax=Sediminibacillus albus TaxID=407036 RepID=A0A1G8W2A5_9BACI|nr:flagellar basal-body MS-ring/collar protein FliF [Sediminibacillus albus]SDJ72501.1 flagellar M-ring protein FliF [Sediminibacillus albus]